MDDRGVALGEPDMVRVASEPYRQPSRLECAPGRTASVQRHRDRLAATVRPVDRPRIGFAPVCPLARPSGLRSSSRRLRMPVRVTGGGYAPDPSGPHLDFHRATQGLGNHGSRGCDACGLRKPIGLMVPPPAAVTGCTTRSPAWPVSRCRGRGPVWQSLETNPIRSRRRYAAPDGLCHPARFHWWRVAEMP